MPIKFAAKKIGWSQSDKGFVLRLLVSPDDDWTEAANAPLGSPFGVVMVPIDPESGVSTEASPGADPHPRSPDAGQQQSESGKLRQPFHKMSRAQQAGILCNDVTFLLWLSKTYPNVATLETSAEAVRLLCGVHSRADLSEDRVAGKKWDQLVTNFYEATGRMAEQRA